MPQIKCSVSNCSFYGEGNNCQAPSVMIEIDRHADYSTEIAGELGVQTDHQDKAANSAVTCCRTFKPKAGQA